MMYQGYQSPFWGGEQTLIINWGFSKDNMDHVKIDRGPGLSGPLSPLPIFIWSFNDPLEVIESYSTSQNGLLNPRYIFKKIWYIWFSDYQDPCTSSHGPFDPSRTLGKWLKVVPHLRMDFGTLGTFLRKFGTSNPRDETPIFLPKAHLFC